MYQFLFVLSLILRFNLIEKNASSCKKGEYVMKFNRENILIINKIKRNIKRIVSQPRNRKWLSEDDYS